MAAAVFKHQHQQRRAVGPGRTPGIHPAHLTGRCSQYPSCISISHIKPQKRLSPHGRSEEVTSRVRTFVPAHLQDPDAPPDL
uniref:Uncharacterized protein n=1 Tax=Gasterosteus aculeatus TaxID=69293 RepID=G3N773_GASAC